VWYRPGRGLAVHHLPDHHHLSDDDDHHIDDATASTTTATLEHNVNHDDQHDNDNTAHEQQHTGHHHHDHTRRNDNNSTRHHHHYRPAHRPAHQPAHHHTRATRHQMNPTPERIEPLFKTRSPRMPDPFIHTAESRWQMLTPVLYATIGVLLGVVALLVLR
jgi:hypothetical protein